MLDPPGPGLEPLSPALAGGFSTAVPPGKPLILLLSSFSVSRVPRPKAQVQPASLEPTFCFHRTWLDGRQQGRLPWTSRDVRRCPAFVLRLEIMSSKTWSYLSPTNDLALGSSCLPKFLPQTGFLHSTFQRRSNRKGRAFRPEAGRPPLWLLVALLAFSSLLLSRSCVWSSGVGSQIWVSVGFSLLVLIPR